VNSSFLLQHVYTLWMDRAANNDRVCDRPSARDFLLDHTRAVWTHRFAFVRRATEAHPDDV